MNVSLKAINGCQGISSLNNPIISFAGSLVYYLLHNPRKSNQIYYAECLSSRTGSITEMIDVVYNL